MSHVAAAQSLKILQSASPAMPSSHVPCPVHGICAPPWHSSWQVVPANPLLHVHVPLSPVTPLVQKPLPVFTLHGLPVPPSHSMLQSHPLHPNAQLHSPFPAPVRALAVPRARQLAPAPALEPAE